MYELLASRYSALFPPDNLRCGFVIEEAGLDKAVNPSLIDAGCADGDLAIELARAGCDVTGIDPDESMIRYALERRGTQNNPSFLTAGMEDIAKLGRFNAITCFGNTLPHLPSTEAVQKFFMDSAEVLETGGSLIFQIINFDILPASGIFNFPDIRTAATVFKRSYSRRDDGRINFSISLTDKKTGETVSDSTPLLPLKRDELLKMLTSAGFTGVRIYSGYDRSPAGGSEFSAIYAAALLPDR